jgi:hypothetical protein
VAGTGFAREKETSTRIGFSPSLSALYARARQCGEGLRVVVVVVAEVGVVDAGDDDEEIGACWEALRGVAGAD